MLKGIVQNKADYFYFVFRVIIGVVFILHGTLKLPGIFQGTTSVFSLMGLAGIIEVVGGSMIVLGLLTRYVAVITAIEMLVAYFKVHLPMGLNPLSNKGEAALLFFAAFLVLIAFGSKRWGLDQIIKK